MAKKYSFEKVPVGGGRRYQIICNGDVVAGFHKRSGAQTFINMQKAKKNGKGGPAAAAGMNWDIKDIRE